MGGINQPQMDYIFIYICCIGLFLGEYPILPPFLLLISYGDCGPGHLLPVTALLQGLDLGLEKPRFDVEPRKSKQNLQISIGLFLRMSSVYDISASAVKRENQQLSENAWNRSRMSSLKVVGTY